MASTNVLRDAPGEWARAPRSGTHLEGLSRSHIFLLIRAGAFKTVAIRAPGAARAGQRLIHLPSLRAWINGHVESQANA